jgi:hypothetical protein
MDLTTNMEWVELYSSAMLERDPVKFAAKAAAARQAISEKLQEIDQFDETAELEALQEALHNLKVLTRNDAAA